MIEASADIDEGVRVPDSTKIWHLAQVRSGARIGEDCIIGRGAYIGAGVEMGDACKVQNYALLYEPARLGKGVFIGPAAVLTNDRHPRAINEDGSPKTAEDWEPVGVSIGDGASIGARSVCVAPVSIGRWALVAAGSVVTKDVPNYALVAGVPAKRIGWVGEAGVLLIPTADSSLLECPTTGARYRLTAPEALEKDTR